MTTYPRLIYDNFWRKGTALPADPVADPQHPAYDSQMDTKSMYFQSSTLVHPSLLPMDLGGVKEVDFVAVLGHNFADIGSSLTLQFQLASNSAFDADLEIITLEYAADNMFKFFTTYSRQFARLRIERGSNFTAKPKVGTIFCGKYVELNRRPQKGYTPGKDDITEIEESDSRVIFAQEKDPLDEYRYTFKYLNDAIGAEILLFLDECRKNRAFVWCKDHTAPNTNSVFVRNTEMNPPVFDYPKNWDWKIAMREII